MPLHSLATSAEVEADKRRRLVCWAGVRGHSRTTRPLATSAEVESHNVAGGEEIHLFIGYANRRTSTILPFFSRLLLAFT